MELTNQVATLQDEVKLLKGEIKSILKEIRTAVLSRDNPFSAGMDTLAVGGGGSRGGSSAVSVSSEASREPTPISSAPSAQQEPASGHAEPPQAGPAFSVPASPPPAAPPAAQPVQAAPVAQPAPQGPIVMQGGGGPAAAPAYQPPPTPAWAGPVPAYEPAPQPFVPAGYERPAPPQEASPMPTESRTVSRAVEGGDAPHVVVTSGSRGGAASAAAAPARKGAERSEPEADREPIPIRGTREEPTEEQELDPQAPRPSWSLPSLASLAVWAEDALLSLGPRRYLFVLELATFADLLPADAQDVLAGLIDAEALDQEDTRPLNVNECLVVLRQLDAIVHGEKVVRLPRRRGIRHRRIR